MLMESLMMEEKQLDFNRPLLSVRRPVTQTSESESKTRSFVSVVTNKILPPPSSSSPPVYKSDIKSGPIRNPGTVPFQWEHKPGKPKDESQCLVETHFVPKLPPGREQEQFKRKLEVKTVGNNNVASLYKFHMEDVKSYDDDDDTYLEATDTFSRSESFFFNCSNVSGLDGSGILVEPFGTLSSDRQTQELMMGRFLPAAKALTASETLPQLSKKPPKPEEEPQRRLIKKEKQNKTEYRFHHSDQEEEDLNSSRSIASGVCGLVPQICLRSSFGILNPVPSVRMQAQRAVSVRRMRSKYQDSIEKQNKQTNETVNEDKRNESVAQRPSQSVSSNQERNEKLDNFSAVSRAKVSKKFGELLANDDNTWPEAPVAEKTLYVDTVHSIDKKVEEEFKKQSLSNEYPSLDVLGPPVKEDVPKSIGAGEETFLDPKRDEDKIEFSSQKVEECHGDHQAIVALQESNKIDLEVNLERNTTRIHHHIVPPPPLPKAPSDSWLKRTLPTIPSKNNSFTWLQSSDNNNHFTKIQSNPKWETMVKTSNTPFFKEPLNPIPEA